MRKHMQTKAAIVEQIAKEKRAKTVSAYLRAHGELTQLGITIMKENMIRVLLKGQQLAATSKYHTAFCIRWPAAWATSTSNTVRHYGT